MSNIVIPDGGTIGSASDTDAIAISSGGVTTFSQNIDITGNARLLGTDADTSSQVLFNDTGGQEWGIQYDAGALKFSESGVATQLTMADGGDIYSEPPTSRTWTVVGISSLSQNSNFYRRIGKMVFVSGYISGNGSATTLSITNLPYTSKSGVNQSISVSVARDNGTFTSEVTAQVDGSSTNIVFLKSSQSGGFSSGGGSKRVQFAGWYEAETV